MLHHPFCRARNTKLYNDNYFSQRIASQFWEQGQETISEFEVTVLLLPIRDASASSHQVCNSNSKHPGARPGLTASIVEDYRKLQHTMWFRIICFRGHDLASEHLRGPRNTGPKTFRTSQPRALSKKFNQQIKGLE
jgi:hypothetical protein